MTTTPLNEATAPATVPCACCGNPLDAHLVGLTLYTFTRSDGTRVNLCFDCADEQGFCLLCGIDTCSYGEDHP